MMLLLSMVGAIVRKPRTVKAENNSRYRSQNNDNDPTHPTSNSSWSIGNIE